MGNKLNITRALKDDVILGSHSGTPEKHQVGVTGMSLGQMTTTDIAGKKAFAMVSVGDVGKERQIKNMGAGHVGPNSTDAINGSQLYAVSSRAVYYDESHNTVILNGSKWTERTGYSPVVISNVQSKALEEEGKFATTTGQLWDLGRNVKYILGRHATWDPAKRISLTAEIPLSDEKTYKTYSDAMIAIDKRVGLVSLIVDAGGKKTDHTQGKDEILGVAGDELLIGKKGNPLTFKSGAGVQITREKDSDAIVIAMGESPVFAGAVTAQSFKSGTVELKDNQLKGLKEVPLSDPSFDKTDGTGATEKQVGAVNARVGTLQNSLKTTQGDVTTLKADMAGAKGDIGTLKTNFNDMKGNVSSLQGSVTTLKTDMTSAKSDIGTLKGKVSTLTDDVPP